MKELSSHDAPRSGIPALIDFYRRVNDKVAARLEGETLCDLVATQIARTPDAIAIVDGEERHTYRQLGERVEQIAAALTLNGVGLEQRVAVYLPRGAPLIVALLAVQKAGGAYVPLDPAYPSERTFTILEDSDPLIVLTSAALRSSLPPLAARVLEIEALLSEHDSEGALASAALDAAPVEAEALAYLIYTSGSTGRPKGVAIPHRCAVNLVRWAASFFAPDDLQAMLFGTSVNFDLSIWEIFLTLSVGGKIIMAPNALALPTLPARDEISFVNTVPSAIAELVRQGPLPASVHSIALAGEALRRDLVKRIFAVNPDVRVYNLYAPSETTTYSTYTRVLQGEEEPTIGAPFDNTRVFVLDRLLELLPAGEVGELYLGGSGVTRGYLGRPALTAAAFVPDPFHEMPGFVPGDRLYKTGDLVRLRPDGELEFLGRRDHQVKIRGFRVELGEIETAIEKEASVKRAALLAPRSPAGDLELVAFLEPEAVGLVSADLALEVRAKLARSLPAYMVPGRFEVLSPMPLLPNGKIDRKSLAARPLPPPLDAGDTPYEEPATSTEKELAALFSEMIGTPRVGRHDSFHQLGGHSLIAARLATRWREKHGIQLELADFFTAPTLSELAALADRRTPHAGAIQKALLGSAGAPLSYGQESLHFIARFLPDSPLYNVTATLELKGKLEAVELEAAWNAVFSRHETLHGVVQGDHFLASAVTWQFLNEQVLGEAEAKAAIESEGRRPFDLEKGPVTRVFLYRISEERVIFHFVCHHLVFDGWSLEILVDELGQALRQLRAGGEISLPPLDLTYADFASWQRRSLQGETFEARLAERVAALQGYPTTLELPADFPRPAKASFAGEVLARDLPPALIEALRALAAQEECSLFMAMLAAFSALIARTTQQERFLLATPSSGRGKSELDGVIGFFVNGLLLPCDTSGRPSFRSLLRRSRASALAAFAQSDLPFEKITEKLAPDRLAVKNPLAQVIFQIETWPEQELAEGLHVSATELSTGTAKFDLAWRLHLRGGATWTSCEFATDLFAPATIAALLERWQLLLEAVVADPNRPIDQLPILPAHERLAVLKAAQRPAEPYGEDPVDFRVFEEAAQAPQRIAVISPAGELTYGELAKRAEALARLLIEAGVSPGDRVGIAIERSLEQIVALLAIWRAGAAYLPLDTDYPLDRLAYLVDIAEVRLVLTRSDLQARLPASPRLLCIDALPAASAQGNAALPSILPSLDRLATVLFTSGSTGRPKGVSLTHRALVRLHRGDFARLDQTTIFLNASRLSFDVSSLEIWGPLVHGGCVVLISPGPVSFDEIAELVERHQVSHLWLTAGLFHAMVEGGPLARLQGLRYLLSGGDVVSPSHVRKALEALPGTLFVDGYGPTENGTFTTCFTPESAAQLEDPLPIGKSMLHTTVFIAGRHLEGMPPGLAGELLTGGDGLARGYVGQPALTAEKFVPDPFSGVPGARLYRTGDLARLRQDGLFEFLGRIDQQIKIRGFRIEPGEIEAVLAAEPGVDQAVVLAVGEGAADKRLVAFVLPQDGCEISETALRERAGQHLPDFMMPALIHIVRELPLGETGKVDRRRLSEQSPGLLSGLSRPQLLPPRTPLEARLHAIWHDLLDPRRQAAGLVEEDFGVLDDFFALGGHSLLAAQLASRLLRELGRSLPLRAIFDTPTIAGLAKLIEEPASAAPPAAGSPPGAANPRNREPDLLPRLERKEGRPAPAPLSAGQEQLFFLQSLDPEDPTFNMPLLWRLRGPLDLQGFELAWRDVLSRHEILRTTFELLGGKARQVVHPEGVLRLETCDLRARHLESAEEEAMRLAGKDARLSFALGRLPLFRVSLYLLSDEESLLAINLHHLIGDGPSFELLFADLETAYLARCRGESPAWPAKDLDYADFAAWQQQWLEGEEARRLLEKRSKLLTGGSGALHLPSAGTGAASARRRGGLHVGVAPAALVQRARHFAANKASSFFMVLLSAFEAWLARVTGADDLRLGTPITARRHPQLEKQIGFFVNTAVLRVDAAGDPTFDQLLGRTREVVLDAFEDAALPYGRLVAEIDRSRQGLFAIFFALDHAPNKARFADLERQPVELSNESSQFELSLIVNDDGDLVELLFEYDADLFPATTIRDACEDYLALLDRALLEPGQPLSQILPQPRWPSPQAIASPEANEELSPKKESDGAPEAANAGRQELLAARLAKAKAAKLAGRQGPSGPARQLSRALIPIETQGEGPPLFCVHPAGGDVLCFEPLARHLGRPLYGLQSRGLVPGASPDTTIADMAEAYLEEIAGLAAGPIHLAGWSLGGMVAFEMACQLEKQGRLPQLLAIFDSLPALPPRADLDPADYADDTRFLLDIADYARGFWGKHFGLDEKALQAARGEAKLELFLAALRDTGFLPPGARSLDLRRLLDVFKANTRAAYEFEPQYYGGRIELFVALDASPDTESSETKREADLGWSRHAAAVGIHPVAANHVNLIAEPHVAEVAAILLSLIGNER